MTLSKAEMTEILDETQRLIVAAEREAASWRQIVAMSAPGWAGTHQFKLARAERQLAGVQDFGKAIVEAVRREVSGPSTDEVDRIMAETVRVTRDLSLWPAESIPGKANLDDDDWWLDYWDRQGKVTRALTNVVAKLSARGIDAGVDVMAELGPTLRAARTTGGLR